MKPQEHVRNSIKKALETSGFATDDPKLLLLEKPKQENFGDISSPVAMNLAKVAKKAPRAIAQQLVETLEQDPDYIEKIEIAGPGFINFHLAKKCLQDSVHDIINEGENYGKSDWGKNEHVQLEFVSANPTGPLNVVSARAATMGDILTNLFQAVGIDAKREYYVNDAGRQINLLGQSLNSRYMTAIGIDTPVPEDGYHGDYLKDLAQELISKQDAAYQDIPEKERCQKFSKMALDYMLKRHQASMENFGVHFDEWFRESRLRDTDEHLKILDTLKANGYTFEKDDAVWFKSSEFGDEKDRVLITSEGRPTYFLVDVAYHQNKYSRGFNKLIDFWGPDHHGYIPRMSAALQALGHPKDSFQVSIIQQVNLLRDGQAVKMSKRAGEIVEMDELINEVGTDAARYFFVNRRMSQPLDFDIELAKQQTSDNPVFYVQYAHARICNVIRFAEKQGIEIPENVDLKALQQPGEFKIIKHLLEFPETVSQAAQFMEPHRVTNYLHDTATAFHKFYHDHKIVHEDTPMPVTIARLYLIQAAKQVLANGLSLLGISAPTNM